MTTDTATTTTTPPAETFSLGWRVYHCEEAGCPQAHDDPGGPWYYTPADGEDHGVYSPGHPSPEAAAEACRAWVEEVTAERECLAEEAEATARALGDEAERYNAD